MSTLQEVLQNIKQYEAAVVQREFKSKKHTVGLVTFEEKTYVFKKYFPGYTSNMIQEYTILSAPSTVVTKPRIYKKDDKNHLLILNYIPGENLCDLINDSSVSIEEKQRLVKLLAQWFATFHRFFKNHQGYIIRGDSILRNFLFTDKIWGVDFEESRQGKPEEDISQLCASILTTDPIFTNEKFHLSQLFITQYEQDSLRNLKDINKHIGVVLDKIIIRRKKNRDILKRYQNEIVDKKIFLQTPLRKQT